MTGMSDEQLEAVTVGDLPPVYQEIVVADYDPIWPHWFESAAFRIREALGDRALEIRPRRLDIGPRPAGEAADRHRPRRRRHDG